VTRETEEAEAITFEDESAPADEPFVDTVEAAGPFSSGGEMGEPFQAIDTVVDNSKTTPIDVGAVMADPQPEPEEAEFELEGESEEDAMDDADTQDFGDTPPIDAESPEISLSDDDIDRIARRVMELYTDRIENIAWDVIPDMAEVVVRERVREIEAEAERESS
jgi:hypothetical protein